MPDIDQGMTLEERKRKVLAQGALYRLGVIEARTVVRSNLNAESLAKGAFKRIAGAASSVLGGTLSSGASLQSLSPLVIGAMSLMSKRYLRKPLMYGGVITAVAGLAFYLSRRNRDDALDDDEDGSFTQVE
ncbi:hypothetical protein PQR62_07785 [Herbaspirillum lusitanum]|uniref:DUF883 domain-containing protein n=1 Tax=Herbaspirillum lusitanum TaxID=213312 RepID=A0ABW9A716_9BURK